MDKYIGISDFYCEAVAQDESVVVFFNLKDLLKYTSEIVLYSFTARNLIKFYPKYIAKNG